MKAKVYAFRDNVGEKGSNYMGVTLYFIETTIRDFFDTVQEHFSTEIETATGMQYYPTPLSTAQHTGNVRDFVFEIGDLKSGKLKYYGHWRKGKWLSLKIFDEFDMGTLEEILTER